MPYYVIDLEKIMMVIMWYILQSVILELKRLKLNL